MDKRYAGFWSRLCAGFIDGILLIPIVVLFTYMEGISIEVAVLSSFLSAALYSSYAIYFHGRWGKTVGKMVMKITVQTLDGRAIGYSEALYRHSVDLVFSILQTIGFVVAFASISSVAYESVSGWMERQELLYARLPVGINHLLTITYLWSCSELIVLLFNEKKRALHDYIAGTVVFHDGEEEFVSTRITPLSVIAIGHENFKRVLRVTIGLLLFLGLFVNTVGAIFYLTAGAAFQKVHGVYQQTESSIEEDKVDVPPTSRQGQSYYEIFIENNPYGAYGIFILVDVCLMAVVSVMLVFRSNYDRIAFLFIAIVCAYSILIEFIVLLYTDSISAMGSFAILVSAIALGVAYINSSFNQKITKRFIA